MKTSMRSWSTHDEPGTAAFTAMRCDLHVHSARSGAVDVPPFTRVANESYAEPLAVYEQARRNGMDLFTLTDHNTIAGGLELAHLPDTFVSEEVSSVGVASVQVLHRLFVECRPIIGEEAIASRRRVAHRERDQPLRLGFPSRLSGARESGDEHARP